MTQFPGPMPAMMQPGGPQSEPMVQLADGRWVPLSMATPPPPGIPAPVPVPGAMGGVPLPQQPVGVQAQGPPQGPFGGPPPQMPGAPPPQAVPQGPFPGAQPQPQPVWNVLPDPPPAPPPLDVEGIVAQAKAEAYAEMAPFGPGLFGGGVPMPLDSGPGGYGTSGAGVSDAPLPLPDLAMQERIRGLDAVIAAAAAKRGPIPEAYQPSEQEILRLRQKANANPLSRDESAGARAALKTRREEKFAERKEARVPDAKRRELVMARARGESPLETRVALGTTSPEDLAMLAGPDALLAMPEAQQMRADAQVKSDQAKAAASMITAIIQGGGQVPQELMERLGPMFGLPGAAGQAAAEGMSSVLKRNRKIVEANLTPAEVATYDEARANDDEETVAQLEERAGVPVEDVEESKRLIKATRDPTTWENLKKTSESWYTPPGLLANLAYQINKAFGGGPPKPAQTSEAARARVMQVDPGAAKWRPSNQGPQSGWRPSR